MLRSFNLDCNAIALDLRTGLILDAGAVEAIRHRRIDFVHDAVRHSQETFAAKAVFLELRLKYVLADGLKRFVSAYIERTSLAHEVRKVFPDLGVRIDVVLPPGPLLGHEIHCPVRGIPLGAEMRFANHPA